MSKVHECGENAVDIIALTEKSIALLGDHSLFGYNFERKLFSQRILSRKNRFLIFFLGSIEEHGSWFNNILKKFMVRQTSISLITKRSS